MSLGVEQQNQIERAPAILSSHNFCVKHSNCLIKKVLERVFIASTKKVLEIIETYRHWQQPVGGKDEAHNATAAGGGGQSGGQISTQWQTGKRFDLD
jgi:hypothetical protein